MKTTIDVEADYMAALREVSALIDLDPAPDSPEGERLDHPVAMSRSSCGFFALPSQGQRSVTSC